MNILLDSSEAIVELPLDSPAFPSDIWDIEELGPIILDQVGMPQPLKSFAPGAFVIVCIDDVWQTGQIVQHPDKVFTPIKGKDLIALTMQKAQADREST